MFHLTSFFSESSSSWLHHWLPNSQLTFYNEFLKSNSRIVTRIGKRQDRSVGRTQWSSFWSTETRTSWRISKSRGALTVSWCNQRSVNVLWIWKAFRSRLPQQDFNTVWIRAVLNLLLLFTLCTLTSVAPEFSHNSGSKRYSPWENSHESNNQDNLSREAENGDDRSDNHYDVCSEMGGSCWIFVEFSLNVTVMQELYRAWYSCFL